MVLGWLFGNRGAGPTAEEIVRRLEETRIERELALREAIVERKNAFKASFRRRHRDTARKILACPGSGALVECSCTLENDSTRARNGYEASGVKCDCVDKRCFLSGLTSRRYSSSEPFIRQIAQARERFPAVLSTGIFSTVLSVTASVFHKNLAYVIPVPAFATYVLHEYHYAYGNTIDLVLKHTEKILEDDAIVLSTRPISAREVHARREEAHLSD